MSKLRRFRCSTVAVSCLTILACRSQPAVTTPVGVPPSVSAPIALAQLLAAVRQENARMVEILNSSDGAGKVLGEVNSKLQAHAYLRRVPTEPALAELDGQVRQLATDKQLQVTRVEHHLVPSPALAPEVPLQPGQRWSPDLAQLRGVVQVSFDLQGPLDNVAGFIDALPRSVERLLVVTGAAPIKDGVRVLFEAYYERALPAVQFDIGWPTLEERLRAAGWDPLEPQLLADPMYAELNKEVELGRERLPAVRRTLQVSADFPRWQLRSRFFQERAGVVLGVRGRELLARSLPAVAR